MRKFYETNYFFIRRLHGLLGIIPIGAFFLVHMFLNSRALQSREAYQWVPDTLDQIPFIWAIEWGFIILPIVFHGILGAFIVFWGEYTAHKPALSFYANWAYVLQRITGALLAVLLVIHLLQTYFVKVAAHRYGEHYDIYGTMHTLFTDKPVWI